MDHLRLTAGLLTAALISIAGAGAASCKEPTYIYIPTAADRAAIQTCIANLKEDDALSYCRFKRTRQLISGAKDLIEHYFANDTTYAPKSLQIGNMVLNALSYCGMDKMVSGMRYPAHTVDAGDECMRGEGEKIGYAVMKGLRND